ncbi:MAG: ankyrin repeat domain-containing protein [Cyanobacteria bacterium P01_H01_bin.58]
MGTNLVPHPPVLFASFKKKQHHTKRILVGLVAIAVLSPVTVGCYHWPTSSASSAESTVQEIPPPLIEATLRGDIERVRSLLASGTDPNLVYQTNTALTYATRDGFTEIARLLINAGADVDWIDGENVTPLILAAFKGHMEIVELLLAYDADPTIVDQWGRTALDYALRRGKDDAIAQLLQPAQ